MMTNFKFLVLILGLLFCCPSDAFSQNNRDEQLDSKSFSERLWYGGNLILGYSGGSFSSLFSVGVAPMVGYKIFENFSAGPRFSITYSSYKQESGGQTLKMNTLDYSVGFFSRYRFLTNIFGHFEYGVESVKVPEYDNNGNIVIDGNEINTENILLDNLYLGAGYTSGGKFSTEIMLLYNFMVPENSLEQPFEIRTGFTYNF